MNIEKLINLLNVSHSQFHVVKVVKEILLENDFKELNEHETFNVELNKKYFVTRNDSSIIAFKTPAVLKDFHFQIEASHTDSPTFKLKQNPVIINNDYVSLNVEPYGGTIYSTWFDRPLSFAGRVTYLENNKIKTALVDIDKDLLVIPNVAIHMNREINSGYVYNPAVDTLPLFSLNNIDFKNLLKEQINKDVEILSHDLYLYNRDKSKVLGLNNEFLSSPRIDNLTSVFISIDSLINSESVNFMQVVAAFDNEEVGSSTRQGALSSFLSDVLTRTAKSLKLNEEEFMQALSKSTLISVDNGHALHPNHPELSDKNKVYLNKGILIKYNASETYTSNALSSSFIKALALKNDIKVQDFENKSNIRGGSTLGNLSIRQVSILTVDIGLPQLAMHSSNEVCAINDINEISKLLSCYFTNNIIVKKDTIDF